MSMQDTGFVQVPVDRFLELVEAEKSLNHLQKEVSQEQASRRGIYDIKGYDVHESGVVIAINFDGKKLLKHLGVIDDLKQEVSGAKYRGDNISVERIDTHVQLSYEQNLDILMEVNK